jgi:hypothetical protein
MMSSVSRSKRLLAVDQSGDAFPDGPEERVQDVKVVDVVDRCHRGLSAVQLLAVRRAKSAKLVGALPVAFSTSLVGCAPLPC